MRTKWRRMLSILLSASLVFSSMVFAGPCESIFVMAAENDGETVDSGAGDTGTENADAQEVVDTETEYTDSVSGIKYKLYIKEDDYGKLVLDEEGDQIVLAEVTGYEGEGGSLTIPQKVQPVEDGKTYVVGKIGDRVFQRNEDLTGVSIPEGVEVIGRYAFEECTNITSVRIPSTITKWREDNYTNAAFRGCTSLCELHLPEGLTTLGQRAFEGCTGLTEVRVPSTITNFPSYVFLQCSALTDLELAEGITAIGYQAFGECTSLVEVTIPSTIKQWNVYRGSGIMAMIYDCVPFYNCASLEKVTFTEGLTTLYGFQGFRGCPNVKEIEIPSSVQNIERAFETCSYLEKVTIKEGLTQIGTNAFKGCSALTELSIPNTVTEIGSSALSECTSLKKLIVPPNVTKYANYIASGSTFEEVYILSTTAGYQSFPLAEGGKIYCVEESATYNAYAAKLAAEKMAKVPGITDVTAEGYTGVYDGEEHDAVTLSGMQESDIVLYRVGGKGDLAAEIPTLTKPGTYAVEVHVQRIAEDGSPQAVVLKTEASVSKGVCRIVLKNMEVADGDYKVEPESYEGDAEAEIIYTYYKDEALQIPCEGKPTEPGEYYVKASVEASELYEAGESNVAKLVIKDNTPTPTPTPTSEPSPSPSPTPGIEPSASPSPSPTVKPDPTKIPLITTAPTPTAKPTANPVSVKKVTLKRVKSPSKKTITVQWQKVSKVSGYQVYVAQNKKFTKGKKTFNVKGAAKTKLTVKRLKSKKYYYVKVCAYKTVAGKKKCGKWSSVKRVKVK